MKIWKHSLLLLFCIGLLSCSDDSVKARKDVQAETVALAAEGGPAEGPQLQAKPDEELAETVAVEVPEVSEKVEEATGKGTAPTEKEVREADRIISFSNQSRDILNSGVYAAADILKKNVLHYRENWNLPGRPKLPARHVLNPRLNAYRGIFTEADEKQLAKALDGMDKSLNEILTYYRQLEKYVNDSSIIDDGKKGLELSEKLLKSHAVYTNARKSWMSLLEARAEDAEARLLYTHPLRRQILAAKNIFAQMKEIEKVTNTQPGRKEELIALRQNLSAIIAEAGAPPFQSSPALERLFRSFLKEAQIYCKILDRGILEGFHNLQRRELREAGIKCQDSYNAFVNAANKLAG